MSDINTRLEDIERRLKGQKKKLTTSLMITIILYGILIVAVFAYTNIVVKKIREDATPQVLAAMLTDGVKGFMPGLKSQIIEHAEKQAPFFAKRIVNVAHDMIPKSERILEAQLEGVVDHLIAKTKEHYLPKLKEDIKAVFDKVKEHKDLVKDENLAKSLSDVLADGLDKELNTLVDKKVTAKMDWLKKEVGKLASSSGNSITNKELAEKKFLMYWLFLIDNANTGTANKNSLFIKALKLSSFVIEDISDKYISSDILTKKLGK